MAETLVRGGPRDVSRWVTAVVIVIAALATGAAPVRADALQQIIKECDVGPCHDGLRCVPDSLYAIVDVLYITK